MSDSNENFVTLDKNKLKIKKNIHFLILDDLEMMQKRLAKDLKEIGFRGGKTIAVKTVEEAFMVLETYDIDVMFIDWNLDKVTSGLEFLKKVRTNQKYKSTPLIMFTSEDDVTKILEAVEAGASSYLVKPWTIDDLKEKLSQAWEVYLNS